MNVKSYVSALIIALTLLVVAQQQITMPNQEIVMQFTDDEVTSDEALNAIEIVKNQLLNIGADNIQVRDIEDGKLKIIYYSDVDVASIKNILSKEKKLELGYTSQAENSTKLPSDDESNSYNFDVFEIHKGSEGEWDFEGTYVLELKPEGDRFSNSKVFASIEEIDIKESIAKVAFKLNYNIAIAIDNTSYKIPEVRAGPIT